jgi:peptidylprolyl isomerase
MRKLPWLASALLLAVLSLVPAARAQSPAAPAAPQPIPAPPDVAAPPADAQTTPSGLAFKVLTPGTGTEHPVHGDGIEIHYTGWTTDGKMIDSSVARGTPYSLPFDIASPGWKEALQLMVEGEKRRLWIPESLSSGRGTKGPLVFDVELLHILKVPPAPADVAAVPADAEQGKSGLAWKVLAPGTGTRKPSAHSTVRVHYTGWTTDGKMFDSSIARAKPAVLPLDAVIPGWHQGLQLMVEGEKRRFWIPKNLAYKGAPGKPQGMLVFDIELIEIVKP